MGERCSFAATFDEYCSFEAILHKNATSGEDCKCEKQKQHKQWKLFPLALTWSAMPSSSSIINNGGSSLPPCSLLMALPLRKERIILLVISIGCSSKARQFNMTGL